MNYLKATRSVGAQIKFIAQFLLGPIVTVTGAVKTPRITPTEFVNLLDLARLISLHLRVHLDNVNFIYKLTVLNETDISFSDSVLPFKPPFVFIVSQTLKSGAFLN